MNHYFVGVDPGASGGAAIITEKYQVLATVKFSGGGKGSKT